MESESNHVPVMLNEVVDLLNIRPGQTMLDCTTGRGGHADAILSKLTPGGRYIGLDVDPKNLHFVRARFESHANPPTLIHSNFSHAAHMLAKLDIDGVDGLLADLGFSSNQVDDPERGMSFLSDGPLDMRLNQTLPRTAENLINSLSEQEVADILYKYGEERLSRRIARKVVEQRKTQPIISTSQLASLCIQAYGPKGKRHRIHPATRTFQALRIAVNDELAHLESLLDQLPTLLRTDAKAVIISFHSLEDRLVKWAFRKLAAEGRVEILTRKPLTPSEEERSNNSRSRSAKLRAIRFLH